MSGVLNALIAPSTGRTSFTLADFGNASNPQLGPSTGSYAVAIQGITLLFIDYLPNSQLLRLFLDDGLPQSYFRRILVEDSTPGTFQAFTSASATFSDGAWSWTVASLWTTSDVGEVKRLIIEF